MKVRKQNNFEIFKKEFLKWQEKLGLIGYRIYFSHEPLRDSYAEILIFQEDCFALVKFNSKPCVTEHLWHTPQRAAKHEAIHLLIGRLFEYAKSRYVSRDALGEADEELVNKLEKLL